MSEQTFEARVEALDYYWQMPGGPTLIQLDEALPIAREADETVRLLRQQASKTTPADVGGVLSRFTSEALKDGEARLRAAASRATNADVRDTILSLAELMNLAATFRAEVGTLRAGWQPIETAPKDGTEVLAYRGSNLMAVAAFMDGTWCIAEGCDIIGVTHWMPLPAPPKAGG